MSDSPASSERGQLRVSYVWREEVMADAVLREPKPITLGPTHRATFTIPNLNLPAKYAILRPSSKGYLLTLGLGMTGKLRVGGTETEVVSFLEGSGGESEGNFRATRIGPGDWGVIHLDGKGEHTFFFQFVKPDPPLPKRKWSDSELLLPALAFAVILHSLFVGVSFWFKDGRNSMVFPGERQLAMEYITERPPPPEEPKEEEKPMAGMEDAKEKEPASTTGEEGLKGGEGEKPRKRDPNPDKGKPEETIPQIRRGLLTDSSRAKLKLSQGGFDRKLGDALARMQGSRMDGSLAGYGKGKGTGIGLGVGTGTLTKGGKGGSGGGGTAQGDFVTQGAIKTGGKGPPRGVDGGTGVKAVAVEVQTGTPSGELGGLTHAEIMKVVRSRRRAIQACYERQLQRVKGLSGKIVVRWKINASGGVMGPKVATTSMRNGGVEDCIVRQVQSMKFPSPRNGTIAVVNFPFIFAPR